MFLKLLTAIMGAPGEGQRKIAIGLYVLTGLLAILIFCVVGIFFTGLGADAERIKLLEAIAQSLITATSTTFGLLIAGNVGEHILKKRD